MSVTVDTLELIPLWFSCVFISEWKGLADECLLCPLLAAQTYILWVLIFSDNFLLFFKLKGGLLQVKVTPATSEMPATLNREPLSQS